jgi:hypothetical protein
VRAPAELARWVGQVPLDGSPNGLSHRAFLFVCQGLQLAVHLERQSHNYRLQAPLAPLALLGCHVLLLYAVRLILRRRGSRMVDG